jgi:TrmH family RNA methyltransferase
MPFETITSFQNSKIKLAQKLHDKAARDREQLFVVDDRRDFARAIACGFAVHFVLYAPENADTEDDTLIGSLDPNLIFQVSAEILAKASYRDNPGGMVAVLHQKPAQTDLSNITAPHVLGLVDLRKPGNIGALLRTADAAGFGAILLIETALDLYNPNIIRSSTGACFLDNIYALTSQQALSFFQERHYKMVAGHPDATHNLFETDLSGNMVLILGTEDTGLNATWQTNCDQLVKIPMMGHLADSLNVSVSGAVMMYEALRQRLHR